LPERNEWEAIINQKGDEKLCSILSAIKLIEQSGTKIECIRTDVTKEEEVRKLMDYLRIKYGKINGLVHCAGVGVGMKGFTVKEEQSEIFDMVISSKVYGTWLLDNETFSDNLDFFVLFSSVVTLIGGIGGGDYTAANSYLDSFSALRRKKGKPSITINWPVWEKTVKQMQFEINEDKQIFKVISDRKAVNAFGKVLSNNVSRLIIGEMNYKATIFKLEEFLPFRLSERVKAKLSRNIKKSGAVQLKNINEAVNLKGKSEGSYSEEEIIISKIWREVLGYSEFDINDNFFDIGGDSVLIMKVHAMIEGVYPGKTVIADMFAYPTILSLSGYLNPSLEKASLEESQKPYEGKTKDDIMDLFSRIEKGDLSFDEAGEMMFDFGGEK
jgi:short-subunit dehydrogenase